MRWLGSYLGSEGSAWVFWCEADNGDAWFYRLFGCCRYDLWSYTMVVESR